MVLQGWIDRMPLAVVFLLDIGVILLAIQGGMFVGRWVLRRRIEEKPEGAMGSVVGATLGLLAFMLAFTFGLAASRFDTRKQLLLDEVNAIGTTYLRSELLPEPQRTTTQQLLREYVDLRASVEGHPERIVEAIRNSEKIQAELWAQAVQVARDNRGSVIHALYLESLNTMIDYHIRRVTVGRYRIPPTIWVVLYAVVILAMGVVGYHFAISGGTRLMVGVVLAVTFSAVFLLICDLDRSAEGTLTVSQQPMIELQQKVKAAAPR